MLLLWLDNRSSSTFFTFIRVHSYLLWSPWLKNVCTVATSDITSKPQNTQRLKSALLPKRQNTQLFSPAQHITAPCDASQNKPVLHPPAPMFQSVRKRNVGLTRIGCQHSFRSFLFSLWFTRVKRDFPEASLTTWVVYVLHSVFICRVGKKRKHCHQNIWATLEIQYDHRQKRYKRNWKKKKFGINRPWSASCVLTTKEHCSTQNNCKYITGVKKRKKSNNTREHYGLCCIMMKLNKLHRNVQKTVKQAHICSKI